MSLTRRTVLAGMMATAATGVHSAGQSRPLILLLRGAGGYFPMPFSVDALGEIIEAKGLGRVLVRAPGLYDDLAQLSPAVIGGLSLGGYYALRSARFCKPKLVFTIDPPARMELRAPNGVRTVNIFNSTNVLGAGSVPGADVNVDINDPAHLHVFMADHPRVHALALREIGAALGR